MPLFSHIQILDILQDMNRFNEHYKHASNIKKGNWALVIMSDSAEILPGFLLLSTDFAPPYHAVVVSCLLKTETLRVRRCQMGVGVFILEESRLLRTIIGSR